MAKYLFSSCAILLICVLMMISTSSTVDGSVDFQNNLEWFPTGSRCSGSIADCLDEEEEFELDSEINRRILRNRRRYYISYGAMRRGSAPCSRRGASYYNCRRGAQANPYTRGCSAITRCRS